MIGLALRGALSSPMELNLRPASVVRRHRTAQQIPYFVMAGICTLLALAGVWLYFDRAASATQAVTEGIVQKMAPLQGVQDRITKVRNSIKTQEEVAAPLLDAVKDRQAWTKLVNEIHSRLPNENIWVTGLEEGKLASAPAPAPVKGGKPAAPKTKTYLVKGLYLQNSSVVDQFVDELNKSDMFQVDKSSDQYSRSESPELWASEFSFPLVLKEGKTAEKPAANKK
jgi:Tfp pilus assembly protein PilN